MAIIDPEGLFAGERLAACSDLAQLYWPRFFLASNSCARLELSYKSIISRVFGNFEKIPESSQIWQVFREYEANFLAIIYEVAEGSWWCQFITSEKYLPKYKKTRDELTPRPSLEALEAHRIGYLDWKKSKSFKNQPFQKVSESFLWDRDRDRDRDREKPTPKAPPSSLAIPDWIPEESWKGFVESRKKLRAPMTDHAAKLIVSKLQAFEAQGMPAGKVLDQSVERGWVGIFALRTENGGNGNGKHISSTDERVKAAEVRFAEFTGSPVQPR